MTQMTTEEIQIQVEARYVEDQSSPRTNEYLFTYTIRLTNMGEKSPRLLRRHWIITDGMGRIHEVKGDGVVGKQPLLEPGNTFEYTSFCPLTTSTGTMKGFYEMVDTLSGREFKIEIPQFFLVEPSSFH
jgi:ApaG protein